MKVYELMNQLKGTNATLKQIKEWSYMNRIPPCDLQEGLELDKGEFPEELRRLVRVHCENIDDCYPKCLDTFFELEIGGGECD